MNEAVLLIYSQRAEIKYLMEIIKWMLSIQGRKRVKYKIFAGGCKVKEKEYVTLQQYNKK